jgi:predicted RNase H-like nuclease (RuvC/YqgF family)
MGLGSTAAKLKKLVNMVEQVFEQMKELRDRVQELDETIDDMDQRLDRIDARGKREEALLSALAEQDGIDVESLLEEPQPGDPTADSTASEASESLSTADSGVDSAE